MTFTFIKTDLLTVDIRAKFHMNKENVNKYISYPKVVTFTHY